jgi:hypothetical protein
MVQYPPPPIVYETYLIWLQDYDYAGVTLVEGPQGVDIEKLRDEYHDTWKAAFRSHEEARRTAREKKLPEPPPPEILDQYNRHVREVANVLFLDAQTYGFACWLVDTKGFKHVNVKRVSI